MKKLLLAAAISSVALFASAEDVNYWVWSGGYTPAETDVVIPTSWDHWWACDFNGDVADGSVLGGKCLSFTGQAGVGGAFSYGISNKWGDFSFTNDVLRDLNLYFYAKCSGPETEKTMVKLTAHTNEEASAEIAGQEVAYDLPKDGEWHLITMNVKNDFPDIYAAWETPGKGYVFSVSCNGVDGVESESTVDIGPIWYAANNTIESVPCEGVKFLNSTCGIIEGNGHQLNIELTPANTTDPVYYESSNPEIVKVDASGFIEGLAVGEADITVTCGAFSDECHVTVAKDAEYENNFWVYTGGCTPAVTDFVIPTSYDDWWACDFNNEIDDETVPGGKCMSFTGQPGGYGAFSYGIANMWGNFSFTNDNLRKLNLYFYAKCSGPETEETYVKLTAHTNEEASAEIAGEEVAYNLPKDGEWHLITMNIQNDFPAIYAAWIKPVKGYVFSCSNKGVEGVESESTVFIGPIWYAAKESGIKAISADVEENGEEVFYNLQGVRINNPENGIFIRVAGGKAVKVIK